MFNNINMFGFMNNPKNKEIFDKVMADIKNSGMSPEEYAANLLRKNTEKIPIESMDKFKDFAKMFGVTDEQIKTFLDNFEKK